MRSTLTKLNLSHIDSHLWTSDVSLANDSFGDGASGTSKGVGGSSNPRRLVVAEVHRFGCHPPCAGSPHDLASCPVAAASVTHDACQVRLSEVRWSVLCIFHSLCVVLCAWLPPLQEFVLCAALCYHFLFCFLYSILCLCCIF